MHVDIFAIKISFILLKWLISFGDTALMPINRDIYSIADSGKIRDIKEENAVAMLLNTGYTVVSTWRFSFLWLWSSFWWWGQMNSGNYCWLERVGWSLALLQQSRIEERLDDAIHVLRNHAESVLHPGAPGSHGLHGAPMMLTHSSEILPGSNNYDSNFAASVGLSGSVDGHLVRPFSYLRRLRTKSFVIWSCLGFKAYYVSNLEDS